MKPVFTFDKFWLDSSSINLSATNADVSRLRDGFMVSYFDGAYKENFLHKRDNFDKHNRLVEMVFHSQNGNRVTVVIN